MKIITDQNEINTYIGDNGLYYNPTNKNLSYLTSISPIDIGGLEAEIKKKERTQIIIGSLYDPYPLIESDLKITRKTLELCDKYKCGVTIFTKSKLILNDIDLLESISSHSKVCVMIKICTTNNNDMKNIDSTQLQDKLQILARLSKLDISLGFDVSPILPFLNDDINTMDGLISLAIHYGCDYFMFRGASIIISNKHKEAVYHALDDNYFGLRSKYDSIRGESYVIDSPKSKMLQSYIEGALTNEAIIFDNETIMKNIYSYQRKHKQLSFV